MPAAVDVSIVIPVYRGEKALPELVERLEKTLQETTRSFEVIFVDDRSPDKSWRVLKTLKAEKSVARGWMRLVRLLKNAGQHNALLCGLSRATGDIVITMDDDLQHPPEELPKLMAPLLEDEDVDLVVGSYPAEARQGVSILGGRMIDATLRRIFKLPSTFVLTSLRAMRGVVAREAAQMTGAYPYVTAMVLSHSTTCRNVEVIHKPRSHGVSNYSFMKNARLSFNLLLNYSSYPLYAMATLCIVSLTVFGGLAVWVLKISLARETVPGWASTFVTLSFSNTVITLSLFIMFLYVVRMSSQIARSRISYAIAETDE